MNVIKRNGTEVLFDRQKIINAITKANNEVKETNKLSDEQITNIATDIENKAKSFSRSFSVEEIQDLVENGIVNYNNYEVAKAYIIYRYKRAISRGSDSDIEKKVIALIDGVNEEIKQENSNKNPTIVSVQRDYMAGELSKTIAEKYIFPKEIIDAHNEGLIHKHDMDYIAQNMTNCCLVNFEDMSQNGTVISDVKIDTPHSFSTACTIMTQIMAQVASSQFGGQSETLSHLVPFVEISRQAIRKEVLSEYDYISEERLKSIVDKRLRKEVNKGVQTIQYQIITLQTTNGQAPFVTLFMYLNEVKTEQEKEDLAMIIEEILKQRMQGVKNADGIYITPAFPKLIYVLEEDNITPDSKYWYLTELAAKCTAKRLVPDYVSEKVMLKTKVDDNGDGHVFPPMGCVDGQEVIVYKYNDEVFVESFERCWNRLSRYFKVKYQAKDSENVYMDLENVKIYDEKNGFVVTKRIIRNVQDRWVKVKLSNGRTLDCTIDHPFTTVNKGRVYAKDLWIGDEIPLSNMCYDVKFNNECDDDKSDMGWLLGYMLCNGTCGANIFTAIYKDKVHIKDKFIRTVKNAFGLDILVNEKNNYSYLLVDDTNKELFNHMKDYLLSQFNDTHSKRHIPNNVFKWSQTNKSYFIKGMIDACCEPINIGDKTLYVFNDLNKETTLQLMMLIESVGMEAKLIENNNSYNLELSIPKVNVIISRRTDDKIHDQLYERTAVVESLIYHNSSKYSYDVTTESDFFSVSGIYSHNCRSFLTPYLDKNNKPKYYGRFNQGVCTINLVDVALSSGGDFDKFWEIFDNRLELCKEALMITHNRLMGTKSDVAPILWQHGALARLKPGETIDKLLLNGYSTISLGYAGLYECTKFMTGKSHTDEEAKPFALKVMQHMNDKCAEWREETSIAFSLYGTPLESTTYKFAKSLQKRFGIIDGITDKNYITNSYHRNLEGGSKTM